jgi:cell wall-associated NlpC family hydrolase
MKTISKRFGFMGLMLMALAANLSADATRQPDWAQIGLTEAKQDAGYWLKRAPWGEQLLMDAASITQRNETLLTSEPTMMHWPSWPDSLGAEEIRTRIESLSKRPTTALFKSGDQTVSAADIDAWMDNLNLEGITASDSRMLGLVVVRTALRRFPSSMRAYDRNGGVDIDRLQESALFPGTPVAILHESRDGKWFFIQSENYAAWASAQAIGIGLRENVMAYATRQPRRYITGSQVRTAFHPYAKQVSELVLDMGGSYPLMTDWPLSKPVNGQGALGSWIIQLPLRLDNGILHFKPALLPRSADTAAKPLPASQASLIRQSFKFLGERYGWGHDYNGRDCSGFVSEVYRSMDILLPRNTGEQQRSKVFERTAFGPELDHAQRVSLLKQLRIGDLVFIPGHVMMVIGHDEQGPWVIHDSHKTGFLLKGSFHALPTNGVAVTPLLPMALSGERSYIDAITAVQRILPGER